MASPLATMARERRADQLSQATFAAFVASRPLVIVHLGPGSSAGSFLSGVIQHFSAEHGGKVGFGSLDTFTLLYDPWALKYVGSIFTVTPQTAPAGYYLFLDGKARAFHPGLVSSSSNEIKADLLALGVAGLLSLAFQSPIPLAATGGISQRHAKAVIAYFEGAMKPPVAPNPPIDWGAFLAAAAPKEDDPYKRLGITATATDEEVEQAYKAHAKLTHPDQVAHLAPEIQRFANDQFVAVKAAYDKIRATRRFKFR